MLFHDWLEGLLLKVSLSGLLPGVPQSGKPRRRSRGNLGGGALSTED